MERNALLLLIVASLLCAVAGCKPFPQNKPAPPSQNKPEPPPDVDRIRAAIAVEVERLIDLQNEDGSWKAEGAGEDGYPVGRTALATLALQQGWKYLPKETADLGAKARESSRKGLAFIIQQWPEPKTYSAGLVEQMLFKAGARGYGKQISMYGWMLCRSQTVYGPQAGAYTYDLFGFPKDFETKKSYEPSKSMLSGRADNSNALFAALGLYYSERSGFQVPKLIWWRLRKYYTNAQHPDGSWDYLSDAYRNVNGTDVASDLPALPAASNRSMTFAGTLGLSLANETLTAESHEECKPRPASEPVERGLAWIAKNFNHGASLQPYGWYACERLGTLTGYSEFGGVDWYQAGSSALCKQIEDGTIKDVPDLAFSLLFLSSGPTRVDFNKP